MVLVNKMNIALILTFFGLCQSETKIEPQNQRDKRIISLFSIVTFPNDQCTLKSDNTLYGTCFTTSECASKSGTVDGNCAAGFGVCCSFTLNTCGSTVNENCTYIQNPTYPSTYTTATACAFSVTPLSTDICQLRLDYIMFDLVEAATGACTDSFIISGPTGRSPMDMCGTLTGHHFYVENGRSQTSTTLTFDIKQTAGVSWKVKVSQIECSSLSRAPTDCNQYITGVSGTFESLNFPTVVLWGKSYSYCIRREDGYCGITYSAYSQATDSFILDALADGTNAIVSLNGLTVVIAQIADSALLIPGGPGLTDLFSGGIFCDALGETCGSAAAIDTGGSVHRNGHTFVAHHISTAITQAGAIGFKLSYAQLPCSGVASGGLNP